MVPLSALPESVELEVPRFAQPDDCSCGPTCLRQVYAALGAPRDHAEVDASVRRTPDGGTVAVWLGLAALGAGYAATLYPFGVQVFDPTWWGLDGAALRAKLVARAATRDSADARDYILSYVEFLDAGGTIRFQELTRALLCSRLAAGHPLVCGLSATWLYREQRQDPITDTSDDVGGEPVGHFVTLSGYREWGADFAVCDPEADAPFSADGRYHAPARRLLKGILLGDLTRDALLLEVAVRAVPGGTPPNP